ncbi:helix-turn-helix transcriptional regulator [Kineococcus sp. SYSU DK002]|uniref:helix-turn-helix transcriptional regulator n=1 Tax=Kineococcus sp. SYSU DK002 TaxID=3383123 RepID=UPI003D7EDE9B
MTDTMGERISRGMSSMGLTQGRLAEAVGVSRATVNAWCTNTKTPSRENTGKIASVLGVGPSYLEYGDLLRSPLLDEAKYVFLRDKYALETGWYFRPAPEDGGRELGNAAVFAFAPSLVALGREVGQNTCDARLPGESTVFLKFTIIELTGDHLDRFLSALQWSKLEGHLEAAVDMDQKAGTVIRQGLEDLRERNRLVLIRVDDYNAVGLVGPESGRGNFAAVARNTLDSNKSEVAGGSFGLGKATMWAVSQFGLVLINSTLSSAEDGNRVGRFIGRMELPWHEDNGSEFAGPAWFGKQEDPGAVAVSYWNNEALLKDLNLDRSDARPGTSFLIVGAYDPEDKGSSIEDMHQVLVDALADNFWAAMVETDAEPASLRASVAAMRNDELVRDSVVDPSAHEHLAARVEMLKKYRSGDVSDDFEDSETATLKMVSLTVPKRKDPRGGHDAIEHEAVLLVGPANSGDKDANRIQYMRGSLMTIFDQPLHGLPLGAVPFRAVVLAGHAAGESAGDRAAERFLRAAENPEHNSWTKPTGDFSSVYARGAKTRINDFLAAVGKTVKDVVRQPVSVTDDGPEGLKELLRITPPKLGPDPRPRVRDASGSLDEHGAWQVEVTVTLPRRAEPWVFDPVLKFGTESGTPIPVEWEEIKPMSNCTLGADGRLSSTPNARTASFNGRTKTASHPVGSKRAKVIVDVRTYRVGA